MTFPGLRSKKDIDDVIAYITGSYWAAAPGRHQRGDLTF
jgi:cytochrome c2